MTLAVMKALVCAFEVDQVISFAKAAKGKKLRVVIHQPVYCTDTNSDRSSIGSV